MQSQAGAPGVVICRCFLSRVGPPRVIARPGRKRGICRLDGGALAQLEFVAVGGIKELAIRPAAQRGVASRKWENTAIPSSGGAGFPFSLASCRK
jgi:hypothetical protein